MERATYRVDLESLGTNFPPDVQAPPLLLEFGAWLETRPFGSVGYFRLESQRFSDHYIENGADLHSHFALFMRDPTGGQIGHWLHDGPRTVRPPVVLIGSEGELLVLSATLEEFLVRLTEGTTQCPDLDSGDEGARAELARWLRSRNVDLADVPHETHHPNFERWMEDWGRQQRAFLDADSVHLAIANRLRPYLKPGAQEWETATFAVLLVGTQFRVWHHKLGPKPLAENQVGDLEALFRAARKGRAERMPERGLWFSAFVRVGNAGAAHLCCNFMDEPRILDEPLPVPIADYKRDLIEFPRSAHWMPAWLR